MTMSLQVRRLFVPMCFLLGALFVALFALAAVSKSVALSVVAVTALVVYGATAVTPLLAGRGPFRARTHHRG